VTTAPVGASRWLLRSVLGGGAVYFVLFATVHATLAVTSDGSDWTDAVCLGLVLLPQWWLIRRRSLTLSTGLTVAICVLLVAAAVVGLVSIAGVDFPDGYDAWFLGAIAFDLLGLTIVGRFGAAWLSMLLVVAACLGWALLDGRPLSVGAAMIVRHVATLAVGTALAVSLRRSNAASEAFRAVQRRRRTEEDVARARAGARRSAVEQVLEQAGPMLRAIADGRRLTAEDRRQMLVIEGALRDQIRTPRLKGSRLRGVVDTARRRGVNVLLLDEAELAPAGAREQALDWLTAQLERTEDGRFVGRLRDVEDLGVRVSAVRDDDGESAVFR
jgi:hypothetical protein